MTPKTNRPKRVRPREEIADALLGPNTNETDARRAFEKLDEYGIADLLIARLDAAGYIIVPKRR